MIIPGDLIPAPRDRDVRFFRANRCFVTPEEALVALTRVHQDSVKAAVHYLDSARSTLVKAQESVSYSEHRLRSLQKVDLSNVFIREPYVSPFTNERK